MPVFNGHIDESGKLSMVDRSYLDRWIKSHAGKDITFEIKVKKKQRSNNQNRFYHAVVVPMVRDGLRDLGHDTTIQLTHEFLKKEFNFVEIYSKKNGEMRQITQSTSVLSTVEFMDYIAKIQMWAAEWLGIVIPDPESPAEINFTNTK